MDGLEQGFELPQPQLDKQPPGRLGSEAGGEEMLKKSEKALSNPELTAPGSPPPAAPVAQAVSDNSVPLGAGYPPSGTTDATPHPSLPVIADDNDLIEKEWVIKAKQIVDRTKDDPHQQNREINKFKAGYMKKRYGKDLKISEES